VSNPKGKSAAHRSFSKKKNPAIDRLNTRQHTSVGLAAEARNTKADGNSLRSVSTPAMQGKKGNVNSKGRSVTGGASMGGMNIRGAGGLGKSKPKNVELVVGKYKKQVSSDRKAAAKERAGMRAKGLKYESFLDFVKEGDYHSGQGEKIQSRTKKYMEKKGQKGAPGLDAMKARTADHKARRGIKEEGYDRMRDDRLVKYGIGHDGSDKKPSKRTPDNKKVKGKTNFQKQAEKEHGKGVTALDIVKKNIEKKHGKGAIMSTKKEGFTPLKSFKTIAEAAPLAAAIPAVAKAAKVAVVGAKAAKGATVAAKAGAVAKQASVAGTTAGSSAKTAGFGQKLGNAAKEGAKDAAVDHVKDKVRKAAGPKEEDTNEEVINELSSDTLQKASKAADVDRGKKAVAGDKEGAKKRVKQASKFYAAASSKRKQEAKEEYTVTNADKKGNTPAWKGYKSGKKNAKTGKPLYKAADHVKEDGTRPHPDGQWEYHEKEGVKTFKDFMQEGNPTTRMLSKSKSQQTGNISADRGTDAKKNKESRKGLEKDLKKKGIGYKKGTGEYKYDDGSKGREVSYQTSPAKGMSKRRFGKTMRRLGRKHGQESVITKDKNKPARLHDTESKKPGKSVNIGKSKPGKHPSGQGETSGTKVRGKKLSKTTNKPSYHYG
jgi:hypothetical protein